jgi:ubiquinone/menaquinone biosynthesis C-methylase UbiE
MANKPTNLTTYDLRDEMLAGYTPYDGSIEFYSRINALLQPSFNVLDLGAGRGAWYFDDTAMYRKVLRGMKGKVAQYIGADVDEAVLSNPTTDRNLVVKNGIIPVPDASIDLMICDFVLEHVVDVAAFKNEVNRVLKPGGFFCARTPHKASYFSLMARLVKNANHTRWLRRVQPHKKTEDTFPTAYRCNTLGTVRRVFGGWQNFTYIYTAVPAYYFGRKYIFRAMSILHRLTPPSFTGCLFIFLVKN